jgi:hypothetical protein
MQTQVPLWVTIALALASGILTLLGALGSQLISAILSMRTKRLEMSYGRKADIYRDFVVKAGTFGHDPWDEEKYVQFLHSYLAVLLVASDKVNDALVGEEGVHNSAQLLRTSRDYGGMSAIQSGSWLEDSWICLSRPTPAAGGAASRRVVSAVQSSCA